VSISADRRGRMGWVASVVAAIALVPSAGAGGFDPFAVATLVAEHRFGHDSDADYDGLPDGWSRRSGPGFPSYVPVDLEGAAGHDAAGSLRIGADGAAAAIYGSPIDIDGGHHYLFEAYVRTQRLRGDAAVCSVSVLDSRRRRLARHLTVPVSGTHSGWVRVRVGPLPPVEGQRFLVVGCHLVRGEKSDLEGAAWFDDVRVGSTPVLALTGKDARFRRPAEPTTLVVTATGLEPEAAYSLSLALRDVAGKELGRLERAVRSAAETGAVAGSHAVIESWPVPGADHGFYRFEADLRRQGAVVATSEATFVVTDETPASIDGPFGWSVAEVPGMAAADFALAAAEAGVARVKLPLWRNAADRAAGGRASELVERLAERQVATVGVLDPPPAELRRKFSSDWSAMGEVFRLRRDVWAPALDPLIAAHAARVRHWQLGHDGDASFAELPELAETLAAVRAEFDRVGHHTRIGIPWPADRPPPPLVDGFVSILNHSEGGVGVSGATETWAAVRPSGLGDGPEVRGADLVRKIVAARAAGGRAVYATDVLDAETGLIRPDGAPTELYLPWRTAAVTLGVSTNLGPIALAGGSESRAFESGGAATVVIWSEEQKTEVLTPGGSPALLDIWGRRRPIEADPTTGRCQVPVGPSPVFVTGASAPLLRWQMAAGFAQSRLGSQHGPQPQAVVGVNPFDHAVNGTVTLAVPEGWQVEPGSWDLRLAAGESFHLPATLTLPPDASLGSHDLGIEFDIQADRAYRFTVRRQLVVGLGELDLEVPENVLPDGRLEVSQTITNRTSPTEILTFRCDLFVPGAQRQRQYVLRLGAGQETKRYLLGPAEGLAGRELWLRAEQENGRRVLNYRWTVGKDG